MTPDNAIERTLLQINQVASAIQCFGTIFVAVLMLLVRRSVERKFLDYWSTGWCCWAVSLLAINGAFSAGALRPVLLMLYCLFGCLFCVATLAGCVHLRSNRRLDPKWIWFWIPAVVIVAAIVSNLSREINVVFAAHALILVVFFVACAITLGRGPFNYELEAGDRVLTVVLILLSLDYFFASMVCGYAGLTGRQSQFGFMNYAPLYDFLLAIFLALGMIMVVMESVRRELVGINSDLVKATERLQTQAEVDPLTLALNRHAFYSLIERQRKREVGPVVGCLALFDVDNLKPINDTYGHPVGDAAIRAVARAIRSAIRSDDLMFRWGGDEFLVVLPGIAPDEAARRFERLTTMLKQQSLPGAPTPVDLSASVGFATLGGSESLEDAIAAADAAMYKQKQARPHRDRFPRLLQA